MDRCKDRNSDQTVITSMCHISSGASEGGTLDGLAEEKEDKKKKALTIFLHCCKSRRWCEITSCCYKPFGRGEGVGT